jgi:cyclopropane fatty-acyl-phospholipid synthase-like methyltransferase
MNNSTLEHLRQFDDYNGRALLAAFAVLDIPGSLLDLGSGTGSMVEMARRMGIPAFGVDRIAEATNPNYLRWDLEQPLDLQQQYGMVVSIETAEHLEPHAAPVFCDTIAKHLKEGGRVVFTAAGPGQAGEHHVNCKPGYYWRELLHVRGVHYREDLTYRLKACWETIPMATMWLPANLQVFDR